MINNEINIKYISFDLLSGLYLVSKVSASITVHNRAQYELEL